MFKRAIIGFFRIFREKATRQLPFGKMIRDAIAAHALPAARLIGAVTASQIIFLFAFHEFS